MTLSPAEMLPNAATAFIDRDFLGADGFVKLLPAMAWQELPLNLLRIWCHRHARYGIVTQELIDYLRPFVVPKSTIELGAGMGDLGHHLGIMMTDSFIQQSDELKLYYATLQAPATNPPAAVRKIEAERAVRKYRPQVAIASWLTQKFSPGDTEAKIGSSVYGPDECTIINSVNTYIHIGNRSVHLDKRALKLPHREYSPPWLVSRSAQQGKNFIAIWQK